VVISAIGGTAGVGKTALALHWAHQVTDRFPDGQLYVNLRGYDPDQPLPAMGALAAFLRSLGVPGQDIPQEETERATRYRSLLAGKRILVLLDNAATAEQVRPLLPGHPECAVVVTSRDSLSGLVARDGARRLDLDLLPVADAVALLRELIGARVDAEPDAAVTLAELCARLPLALRVAAELAAAEPGIGLSDLVADLADLHTRLDLLDVGGDPRAAVRAVFSWSYRNLDVDAARTFRLFGLHPGPDFELHAVAALTGTDLEQARRSLDALARAHLIQPAAPSRYATHDLLFAYARDLAAGQISEQETRAATTRLFDYYLSTAAAAIQALYPAERDRRPLIARTPTPAPPVADANTAMRWLDRERACLVAMVTRAAREGWTAHATQLSATLPRYLEAGGHYPEALIIQTQVRDAASRAGDRAAQAAAVNRLGAIHRLQADYDQAAAYLEQARALFGEAGDRAGQARALHNLGNVYIRQGRYEQAVDSLETALAVFCQMSDKLGEALALDSLGAVLQLQGRYQQAGSHLRRALALHRELGDLGGEAYALNNLGIVYRLQDSYQNAANSLQRALILFRQAGDRSGEATALSELGAAHLRLRNLDRAASNTQEALALSRLIGERSTEADALNTLGDVLLASGQPEQASRRHREALHLAEQIGQKNLQANSHNGVANCYNASGNVNLACEHWHQALALYTELGAPEAEEVRARLDADQGRCSGHHHREPPRLPCPGP
jgi:tetratricopeptide (TPR) repeat protein